MSAFLPDRSDVVLRHILERNASEVPDKECILFEDGEKWTYSECLKQAYKAGNAFSELGIKRGEHALVFLPNGRDWIRAWWGISSIGAVMVPVNLAYKGELLRHICQDSLATRIVTTPELSERLKFIGLDLEVIDPSILAVGAKHEPILDRPIEPWDIHVILYTSGTTGASKGVLNPYFHSFSQQTQYIFPRATSDDTALVDLPLFHSGAFNQAYAFLALKGRMALRTVFSGSRYLDIVRECDATVSLMIGTIASFLEAKALQPDDADNPLRWVFCAPMPRDPDAFMKRYGLKEIVGAYSSTEVSCPIMTRGRLKDPKTCGRARDGVQLRLVDEHDIPVPAGETGELIIRTDRPWEMNVGYLNRPEETAKAWRNGWFHTGDLFTCDEEGYYFLFDRKKDSIRRRGENISSFEVEKEVLSHPAIAEAACVAAQGELAEDEVKVFIVLRKGAEFDPAELIKFFLIPRMPYFMVPRFIEVMPELPRTATMRVKKYELRARGNSSATWDREAAGIKVTRDS